MGADAVGFSLFLMVIGLTLVAGRTTYFPIKFMAGSAWFGLFAYWRGHLPASIAAGSATDVIVVILTLMMGLIMWFMPFWSTNGRNGIEVGRGFRMRISRLFNGEEEESNSEVNRQDRANAYFDRVQGAMRGNYRRRIR